LIQVLKRSTDETQAGDTTMRYLEPQVTYTDSAELRQLAQNITRMKDSDIFARKREGMDNLAESIGVAPGEYKSQKALLEGIRKRALEIVTRAQAEYRAVAESPEFKRENFFYAAHAAYEAARAAYRKAHEGMAEPGSLYWGNIGSLMGASVKMRVLEDILKYEKALDDNGDQATLDEILGMLRERVLRNAMRLERSTNPVSNALEDEYRAAFAEAVTNWRLFF
jgi:hypothetical protein